MSKTLTLTRFRLNSQNDGARAKMAGKEVVIWSGEHGAWWKPASKGYTLNVEDAGKYLFEDAYGRTCQCGPEKKIEFYLATDFQ